MLTSVTLPRSMNSIRRVAADLLGEPGAAGAKDAALPVEQNQVGHRDGLFEVSLDLHESALTRPVRHGLILERALTAFVTDRAIEWVIGEQELEHRFLGLLDGLALGVDDHPVGDGVGAGSDHHPPSGPFHLHQAHPTHPNRVHPLVPAETGDVGTAVLGGLDDQGTGTGLDLLAVDGDANGVRHAIASTGASGHRPKVTCSMTSSRK